MTIQEFAVNGVCRHEAKDERGEYNTCGSAMTHALARSGNRSTLTVHAWVHATASKATYVAEHLMKVHGRLLDQMRVLSVEAVPRLSLTLTRKSKHFLPIGSFKVLSRSGLRLPLSRGGSLSQL